MKVGDKVKILNSKYGAVGTITKEYEDEYIVCLKGGGAALYKKSEVKKV